MHSVVLAQKDNDLVVLAHFSFGLRVQYHLLQGMWYLTCTTCNGRIEVLRGGSATACVKCRKSFPQFTNAPLFHMHGVRYGPTVDLWIYGLVDAFDMILTGSAVADTLRDIAVRFSKPDEDDPSYTNEEIELVCRAFSGPIEF